MYEVINGSPLRTTLKRFNGYVNVSFILLVPLSIHFGNIQNDTTGFGVFKFLSLDGSHELYAECSPNYFKLI